MQVRLDIPSSSGVYYVNSIDSDGKEVAGKIVEGAGGQYWMIERVENGVGKCRALVTIHRQFFPTSPTRASDGGAH